MALASWIAVGGEGGIVLLGAGPTPDGGKKFLPVHGAARGLLYLGSNAREHTGFVPYVLLSGGLRQIDAKQSVTVVEDQNAPPPPNQPDNPAISACADSYVFPYSAFFCRFWWPPAALWTRAIRRFGRPRQISAAAAWGQQLAATVAHLPSAAARVRRALVARPVSAARPASAARPEQAQLREPAAA